MENIVEKIDAHCKAKDIEVKTFMSSLKMNMSNYYRWRNGDFYPRGKSLMRILNAIGESANV